MTTKPIAHGDFSIERFYDAPPARVFAAWSNIETKARWFVGPEGWTQEQREMDFTVGGKEVLRGRFPSGLETFYEARFHQIIADERIVCVYDVWLDRSLFSTSLSTVEIEARGGRTRLVFTEQIALLDGKDPKEGIEGRERGVAAHLDRMTAVLRE